MAVTERGPESLAGLEHMAKQKADVDREIRERLEDWRAMLPRNVPQGRQILRKLVTAPLRFQPVNGTWEFSRQVVLGKILAGFVDAKWVASPKYDVLAVEMAGDIIAA